MHNYLFSLFKLWIDVWFLIKFWLFMYNSSFLYGFFNWNWIIETGYEILKPKPVMRLWLRFLIFKTMSMRFWSWFYPKPTPNPHSLVRSITLKEKKKSIYNPTIYTQKIYDACRIITFLYTYNFLLFFIMMKKLYDNNLIY